MLRLYGLTVGSLCALSLAAAAPAATIALGTSGWEATWDVSLDPYVSIDVLSETSDTVFIRKNAEFIQGPDMFGQFPSIPIAFRQTDVSSLSRIVIEEEAITNSTGVDWRGFRFDVLDGGDAVFFSGAGFSFDTTPFLNQAFDPSDVNFTVDAFGSSGVVADGSMWNPGAGASGGELIIDVVSQAQAPFTVFSFKENPIPEPSTLALLLLTSGGLALRRRGL